MKICIIIIAALSVLNVLTLFFNYHLVSKLKGQKKIIENLKESYDGLSREFAILLEAEKIRSINKEVADEEIKKLHSGDALSNAIAGLSKQ